MTIDNMNYHQPIVDQPLPISYAKQLLDIFKTKVFECIHIVLDLNGVVYVLTTSTLNSNAFDKQTKVLHWELLCWEMVDDKDIKLPIEKLPQSWIDYKQPLKHQHKQECVVAKAKALTTKEILVEDKPTRKRYDKKYDHKNKTKNKSSYPHASNTTFKKRRNYNFYGKSSYYAP
ncbi:hypothetical protein CR513_21733, partial [Mucuna pruriens]